MVWPAVVKLVGSALVCAAVVVAVAHAAPEPPGTAVASVDPRTLAGWASYDRLCLACHGAAGDGQGPAAAWVWPRPRDLRTGEHAWASTPVGEAALDDDLARTIRWGVPGAMPAFGAALDDAAVAELVAVVRAFAPVVKGTSVAGAVPAATGGDAARGATLWTEAGCANCHGAGGAGDGAVEPHPYDLTAVPLRRPRASDDPADVADALYRSIAFGLTGTAMPGFASLGDDDLRALVAHVDGLRWRGVLPPGPGPIPDEAIARDKKQRRTHGGYWAGNDPAEAVVFGETIRLQGEPPDGLTPAQASLSSRRCGRCHASQLRDWKGSIHASAASPGLLGQLARMDEDDEKESCMRCHAPLAEQQPRLRPGQTGGDDRDQTYADSPWFDDQLRDEGLTCAACHVRDWTRHGPTTIAGALDPLPGYPKVGLALYERADFCMPCHQLQPRNELAGRPLLDTYREWLTGPYMPRGVQCQHCHMPERAHTWKGIHDPETFRQGIRVEAIARRGKTGVVSVRARLWNEGAGHMLPTTPTPAAWLEIELVDAKGRRIKGARASQRIGRNLDSKGDDFIELEDTRVAPGASIEVAGAWHRGRVSEATHAKITVRVAPDEYYERLYASRLDGKLTAEVRAQFEAALERAIADRYVAEVLLVEL